MKKALMIAAPFLLIAAAFAAYFCGLGTQYKYVDTRDHWAKDMIEKWSGYGIIGGSDGKFRPDDAVTLAEFCTLTVRVVPIDSVAENTFSDLSDDAWYAESILKCVYAGLLDSRSGELHPTDTVTREAAICMFAKALGIEGAEGTKLLDAFHDIRKTSAGCRPYIEAMLEAGIVQGRGPGQLNPTMEFTRAEMVAMMDASENAGYISVGKG